MLGNKALWFMSSMVTVNHVSEIRDSNLVWNLSLLANARYVDSVINSIIRHRTYTNALISVESTLLPEYCCVLCINFEPNHVI
jgi:hypothetical protein